MKTAKVFDGPGRGRKQCPKCSNYIGVLTKACNCGHEFAARQGVKVKIQKPKEVATYDEGGSGKKQCAICKKFVGARVSKCACGGEEFVRSQKQVEKKPVTQYDEWKPGRKFCQGCEKYVANRAAQCPCGSQTFGKPKKEEPEKPDEPKPEKSEKKNGKKDNERWIDVHDVEARAFTRAYGLTGTVTMVAANGCPVKLTDSDYDTVAAWAEKLVEEAQPLQALTPHALRFFVGEFFEVGSDKYNEARENITSWSKTILDKSDD
jgi:hypothetical protein